MAEDKLKAQTRLANNILKFLTNTKSKKGAAHQNANYYEARLKLLERYFSDLYERHEELLPYATTHKEHDYFAKDGFDLAEEAYLETVAELSADIEKWRKAEAPTAGGVDVSNRPPRVDGVGAEVAHVKVPRVSLPIFNGKQSEWESFRQRFTSLIKCKREYSDVDKLQYLLSTVQGSAATRLQNLEVIGANFKVAWEKLESRYDNKRRRLSNHLETLVQLPAVRNRNAQDLADLLDKVEVAVRGLQDLGCDVAPYGHWLVHCITRKLDAHTRETWEISQETNDEFFKYEDLIKFIDRRIHSIEDAHGQRDARTAGGSSSKSGNGKSAKHSTALVNTIEVIDASPTQGTGATSCLMCQGKHWIHACGQFNDMNPQQRFAFSKKAKLCLNCLRKSHVIAECKSPNRCAICKQKHHTKLHFDFKASKSQPASTAEIETSNAGTARQFDESVRSEESTSVHFAAARRSILLATAKIKVCDRFGGAVVVRALIDPGAQRSLITERLTQQLTLESRSVSVAVLGVGGQMTSRSRAEVTVALKSEYDRSFEHMCAPLVLCELTSLLPSHRIVEQKWPHLAGLQLADPRFFSPSKIDMILGADVYGAILLDGFKRGPRNAPIAQHSVFGWILTGIVASTGSDSDSLSANVNQVTAEPPVAAYHVITDSSLVQQLTKFWEIEEIPAQRRLSPEEEYCEEFFAATYSRDSSGRFIVRLPFSRKETFPDSREIATACLLRSEKRRSRDSIMQAAYSDFMREYSQFGYMEAVSEPPEDGYNYYMPHHAIARAGAKKIRVVFNASQKASNGYSLNDVIYSGPKLQAEITLVITCWRFWRIVIVTDIVKMFLQIIMHTDDRNWQRFFWRESRSLPIKEYRATTVTFGNTSAPFLAMRALLQLANDGRETHPKAAEVIESRIYVDDGYLGGDDKDEVREQRDQFIDLLATAGMKLGKWSSNTPDLLKGLQGENEFAFPSPSNEIVSTLGIKWDTTEDAFKFEAALPPVPSLVSKRTVLSDTARLFDPLGFIAPVLIEAKIFLQDLWINQLDWDVPLPKDLLDRWISFRSSLNYLQKIRIPRWTGASRYSEWQLHGFADASKRAYAAVIYAVVTDARPIILMAKTKVAPVKVETLPRLELCGATLLARLAKHLLSGKLPPPSSINFWSDSKVVLDWLKSHPSRWPTFVANRVSEIVSSFPEAVWRHVGSKDNSADCASRGMTPLELASFDLWWYGPIWLAKANDEWPSQPSPDHNEARAHLALEITDSPDEDNCLHQLEGLSSFPKITRVLAYCLHWRNIIKHEATNVPAILTVRDYRLAKFALYRLIQRRAYSGEIKCLAAKKPISPRSELARLTPFLDEHGVLRVGGRLHNASLSYSERHPIILPSRCFATRLLVEETHRLTLHGGVQLMKSWLHRTYWIVRGNRLISAVYHRCVTCVRFGVARMSQQMAPLPAERLSEGRPFSSTGIDFAGPFPLLFSKGRGAKTTKGYVAIFVCLVVKAVHVEVVSDLTTDAFLAAYSRFTHRRGRCVAIYSDNGRTFKGAEAELHRLFQRNSMFSKEVFPQLAAEETEWKYIPPRAPHFGGLWEAAVKSFKYHLRRVIGTSKLTFEEFDTLAIKIEACLNSRPLCPLSNEANDPVALTPEHFLIGSAPLSYAEPVHDLTKKVTYNSRWQLINQLRDSFWARWRKEVLAQLQQRNKWLRPQSNIREGDLVIITDELSPPAMWPLALVTKTHPGKDGLVRVASMRTAKTSFVRPITKLLRLPTDDRAEIIHAHFIETGTFGAGIDEL